MFRYVQFLLAILLLSFLGRISHAELIVYEPFNYGPVGSDLNGQSGGGSFGFNGGWFGNTSFDLASGSLTDPTSNVSSTGNRVTADAFTGNRDMERLLQTSFGNPGDTVYLSFLMQAEDVVGQGAFGGWFTFLMRSSTRQFNVGVGSFTKDFGIDFSGGESDLSSVAAVADETHLFVVRVDFTAGNDTFRLYIDPLTGQPEPITPDAMVFSTDMGIVTRIGIGAPGAFGFDEFRLGTTYADVVPSVLVPEPGSLILFCLGAFILVARRCFRSDVCREGFKTCWLTRNSST